MLREPGIISQESCFSAKLAVDKEADMEESAATEVPGLLAVVGVR